MTILNGSYSSSLSVKVGEGAKYKFVHMYYIEIEGSYHKLMRGYNSHDGFYNIQHVSNELIKMVENSYNIKLPYFKHWFIQRCDIAICFDLKNQENVSNYINNLSLCSYPIIKIQYYKDESIYLSGSTSTLKIYNKFIEFRKHDINKFVNSDFDLLNYIDRIKGFIRFECEIKKKKLTDLYGKKYVRVRNVNYEDFKSIWSDEFMKFLKLFDNDLKVINDKNEVQKRLYSLYEVRKASLLYNFYLSVMLEGCENVKKRTCKSTYYRYIKEIKECNIDISQSYKINIENKIINFNPFEWEEVV